MLEEYSEDDLSDMIEFLHDHASKGIDGSDHQFNQCGWHYTKFDPQAGREIFRQEMNDILVESRTDSATSIRRRLKLNG